MACGSVDPVCADGRDRSSDGRHVDIAALSSDGTAVGLEIAVFPRALLTAVVALILSGCVDSERLRQDFGPRDTERAERIPGR